MSVASWLRGAVHLSHGTCGVSNESPIRFGCEFRMRLRRESIGRDARCLDHLCCWRAT